MFNWFKFKPKEDWRLVKTIVDDVSRNSGKEKGKFYYHLFESSRGNRRVEFASTFSDLDKEALEKAGKHFDTYQDMIYRWEHGRVDPNIPRYDQIPEEETVNVLKGKIS